MELLIYAIIFSLLGGLVSVIAAAIILYHQGKEPQRFRHFINFAAGSLLATAFLDLLPEALKSGDDIDWLLLWSLIGFILFFVIEGLFHWSSGAHAQHGEECINDGHHDLSHTPWMLTTGDTIHNLVDGLAIGAAFLVSIPFGMITSFAIATHEIPQEIGDLTIMIQAGWTQRRALFWNLLSSLASVVGAVLTIFLSDKIMPLVGTFLALTGGFFIYISASDLIPEIYRTTRRDKLSHAVAFFFAGIIVVGIMTQIANLF